MKDNQTMSVVIRTAGILLLSALLFFTVFSQEVGQTLAVQQGSTLSFDGTSTLHNFTCDAKKVGGTVTVADQPEGMTILGCTVSVAVKDLESGKESMNENMWETLQEKDHPLITYNLARAQRLSAEKGTSGGLQYNTVGTLTVAGVSKEIEITIVSSRTAEGGLVFEGSKQLLMTDFNVEPPTMFLGVVKTGNEITVRFHLLTTLSQK